MRTATWWLASAMMAAFSLTPAPRAEEPPVDDLARSNGRFALDLYGRLAARPGNLFLSPHSLSTALAMTAAGARGETAAQMARTLRFDLPPDALHPAFAALGRRLDGGAEKRPYTLAVANALWLQEGDPFQADYLALVEKHYGAGLHPVDFRSPDEARRVINAWVEEHTAGKITNLLRPPVPDADTSLVLTNAIYFKGAWAAPFEKSATKDEPFRLAPGRDANVPMMHRAGRIPYADAGAFHAVALPYAGGDLSMVVLVPKEADGLGEMERQLDADRLADAVKSLRPRPVDLALPRFRLESSFELQDVLPAMGMPLAFTTEADFSGINGRTDLHISAVVHKAYVDVAEEGTEAAAATAVVMTREAAIRPQPPVSVRADRPFLFLIRDDRTGALLFLGRVSDPRG